MHQLLLGEFCACLQVQGKLQEQQERAQAAESSVEALKKENATLKGVSAKLKTAHKEIERLREAWTDKDVQLAEANSAANSQRHVGTLRNTCISCVASNQGSRGTIMYVKVSTDSGIDC